MSRFAEHVIGGVRCVNDGHVVVVVMVRVRDGVQLGQVVVLLWRKRSGAQSGARWRGRHKAGRGNDGRQRGNVIALLEEEEEFDFRRLGVTTEEGSYVVHARVKGAGVGVVVQNAVVGADRFEKVVKCHHAFV